MALTSIKAANSKLQKQVARLKEIKQKAAEKMAKAKAEGDKKKMKEATKMMDEAGEETKDELKEIKADVKHMDEDLHPSGHKWWRYRYEYSYVESILMILCVLLALLREGIYTWFRRQVWKCSKMSPFHKSMR